MAKKKKKKRRQGADILLDGAKEFIVLGVVLVLWGVGTLLWSHQERIRYNAAEHYEVTAQPISVEEIVTKTPRNKKDEYDANEPDYDYDYEYLVEWEFQVDGDTYNISGRQGSRPHDTQTLYVYRDGDGEFVIAETVGGEGRFNSTLLQVLLIAGGAALIITVAVKKAQVRDG